MEKIIKVSLLSKLFLTFLILSFALPVWAGSVYYVKSGGNDAADGLSDVTAWKTIAKVEATVTSGDIVYFNNEDTWTGTAPILTAEEGVTYDGTTYGNGVGTRAVFSSTGNPPNRFRTGLIHIVVSNVTVKGFEIDGNNRTVNNYGIAIGSYGHDGNPFSGITIDNCYIHNTTNRGLYIGTEGGTGNTISDVTITNTEIAYTNQRTSPSNGGGSGLVVYPRWNNNYSYVDRVENLTITSCTIHDNYLSGVYFKDDIDDVVIENCNIYNNTHGFNIECSSDAAGETDPQAVTIRSNYIHDNKSYGILFTNGSDDTIGPINIYNNLLINNVKSTGSGIQSEVVMTADFDESVINFYNNTFYNIDADNEIHTAVITLYYDVGASASITFKNNIVYTANDLPIYDNSGRLVHSNNLIYRSSGETSAHVYSGGITYYRDGTRSDLTNWEATVQKTDPLFADASGGDYRITSGSDAIGKGADLSAYFTTDYYGNTRPNGPGFDIGAHEYQGADNTSPSAPPNLRVVTP